MVNKKKSNALHHMSLETMTLYSHRDYDHSIPIRMAKLKNTDNTKCWQRCEVTGTFIHC